MLSRVGERIFWLARYVERVESTARLVNVHTALLMDLPEHREMNWFSLITIFDGSQAYFERYDWVNEYDVMHFLLADTNYSGSLVNALFSLRENARTSLDVLPESLWEQINELHLLVKGELSSIGNRRRRQKLLLTITERCQCVWGIIANHMSRNSAYDFLLVGKHLERADMTSRILEMTSMLVADSQSDSSKQYESLLWATLLRALSAQQMYIQENSSSIKADKVLTFLITDQRFPRSLCFSINALGKYLNYLPRAEAILDRQEQILSRLQQYDVQQYPAASIRVFMDELQLSLSDLTDDIVSKWFYPDYSAV
jgi:uncharacterized alpha-E superfamily protein